MIRVPTDRRPTHPGEMLPEEFLKPMGVSQQQLAKGIKAPYQRVNEIVNKRRGITPATARRLATFFGTPPAFWMNLQPRRDVHAAQSSEREIIRKIRPLHQVR